MVGPVSRGGCFLITSTTLADFLKPSGFASCEDTVAQAELTEAERISMGFTGFGWRRLCRVPTASLASRVRLRGALYVTGRPSCVAAGPSLMAVATICGLGAFAGLKAVCLAVASWLASFGLALSCSAAVEARRVRPCFAGVLLA